MINENSYIVKTKPTSSNNYLVTIAIGQKYLESWECNALPLWEEYASKNDLGIIVFHEDLVSKDYEYWKKATWQKLLIGDVLANSEVDIENVCYLDTDILINPFAPNVFDGFETDKIGVVSLKKNIPQPLHETLRREAFLRHTHYDNSYPLDSALFSSIEQLYVHHDLEPQDDFFCAGLFVFNVKAFASTMREWFDKYPSDVYSITGGGDQTHLNYEFLNNGMVQWLDYRFQAIWVYEMAWKYPFLYSSGKDNAELIRECVEAALYANYFLHFAGSWHESDMWSVSGFFGDPQKQNELKDYYDYLSTEVTGQPKGIIKPGKDS